jgi:photosystem II stability/assembly factor-like uncharacterized protein
VGKNARIYIYSGGGFLDESATVSADYRSVSINDSGQVWVVGSAGTIRFSDGATNTADVSGRVTAGAWSHSANFYATYATDDTLFAGGDGVLLECAISYANPAAPDLEHPSLACTNAAVVSSSIKVRGLAGTSSTDVWAAGIDVSSGSKPVLLHRKSLGSWETITLPATSATGLLGIARIPNLLVVVGDNGVILSKPIP